MAEPLDPLEPTPAEPAGIAPAPADHDGDGDGTIAAALIACGLACLVFGLAILLAEHVAPVKKALTLSEAVGSLSGKAVAASIAYAVSWPILHVALRNRQVALRVALLIALPMITTGFLLTFPPVYLHLWF